MHIPPSIDLDGLVKSPSAALRFTFVVAACLYARFTPQLLRALHLELFTKPSSARFFAGSSRFVPFYRFCRQKQTKRCA